ncbi:uncharacterized protein LOC117589251 [Drosophila guanche]|uniref:Serine-rich adhesin for platelets n=1 Tax=Drosophila guanche TaxID=7266 RepID=A0A3B0KKN3_DROGU|nr:uncharacterized protein LOC117589251 [Drosophila guanche]SPP87099.1 Hypothetical predicted protein [Drosophila guanche]
MVRSCSCSLALALALALVAILVVATSASASDYPGVIELVGYSNRRARAYFQEEDAKPQAKPIPPSAKTRADIETVKRNIRKYDRLLELDTKNLPEQQKDMLARIVERVARLKESLDIEEQQFSQQQEATSSRTTSTSSSTSTTQQQTEAEAETEQLELAEEQSTLPPTGSTEAETDPTLLLDETTLLELQHTMNEQAVLQAAVTQQTTLMKDLPTTTDFGQEAGTGTSDHNEEEETGETTSSSLTTQPELSQETEEQSQEEQEQEQEQAAASTTSDEALTDATNPDDQFVAARSNNNIAAITAADADPSSGGTSTTAAATATNAGSQQRTLTTMGKLKHRQATKRPFGHKVTAAALKRGAQRPTSNSAAAAAANAAAASKPPSPGTTQKQKLSTPNAGYQQKQQTKPALQKVTPSIGSSSSSSLPAATTNSANPGLPIEQLYTRTPQANIPPLAAASSSAAAAAAGAGVLAASTYSNQQDGLVYDGHVNASALIDSLSTNAREEYYQQKLGSATNNKDNKKTATAKPTKYHYYPHNQHIYLLPECAIQQVCNAVYVRLNYTQPLCACPSRYRDPCSASLNEDDQHTTKLVGDNKKKAITLAKTCEATTEMRECRSPKDWSLLALQNTRTGKSHYLVICRCPDHFKMEGPMAHDQPTYASVPGIRVFGMMCVKPGYSVRKPSSQPPKRYQLQKPFYRPSVGGSSSLGGQKDSYGRPIYGGSSSSSSSSLGGSPISSNYQPQDQQSFQNGGPSSSYQYLNRPESTHSTHSTHSSHSSSSANFRPDQFSINNFPGSNYGRNNERRGDMAPIEAIGSGSGAGTEEQPGSSTPASEEARTTLQAQELEQEQEQESEPAAAAAASPVTTLPEPALEGSTRIRRSLAETMELDPEPEFPWDRVVEFQQSIVWD